MFCSSDQYKSVWYQSRFHESNPLSLFTKGQNSSSQSRSSVTIVINILIYHAMIMLFMVNQIKLGRHHKNVCDLTAIYSQVSETKSRFELSGLNQLCHKVTLNSFHSLSILSFWAIRLYKNWQATFWKITIHTRHSKNQFISNALAPIVLIGSNIAVLNCWAFYNYDNIVVVWSAFRWVHKFVAFGLARE